MIRIDRIRNFGVIAHIDSGKTTVSERILYLSGRIHAKGDVHTGDTTLDFDPLEVDKGITIKAAVTSVAWRDHHLNLIDTPGHVDFTAEVERSCRVLDGAVAVFCAVAGVQAQSETVWRQAERYGVPRLVFINKVDRAGADVDRVVGELRARLGARPVLLSYPLRDADGLVIVDVLRGELHRYGGADGKACTRHALPDAERERCALRRRALVEAVAAESDDLLRRFVADGDLPDDAVIAGMRAAVRAGALHPALCGSALATVGVQDLLDAIVDLLPSPAEARPATARAEDGGETAVVPEAGLPLRALVFKVVSTAHGELGFCRVYQGTLRAGSVVWCPNRGQRERVARLVLLHGKERTAVEAIGPGGLGAVIGIRHAATGDTLCCPEHRAALAGIAFAEPVMGMAVEPERGQDREALAVALAKLAREDPTFRRHVDGETGQLVLSGMGELHLEVLAHRLVEGLGVAVRLGRPRVALRSRITRAATVRGFYRRQNSGPGAYGDVTVRFRPLAADEAPADTDLVFVAAVKGGAVDRAYWPAVEDGIRSALARGGLGATSGVRIGGVHATLVDGSMHVQDSHERAFHAAGALAVREGLAQLGLELLEPWMRVAVECPAEHAGAVVGSLSARRGQVADVSPLPGGAVAVRASAPVAELFGYAVTLRSLTQGRGACALEADGFRPRPGNAA